ncbi:signal peptidase II [Alicyclobacillus ferrooxydans]|nr:signal peptidase II [Alicyclobacillus ferrooxydans]
MKQNRASLQPNGLAPNGLHPNGLDPNGLDPNGLDPNGLDPNGLDPNRLRRTSKHRGMWLGVLVLALTLTADRIIKIATNRGFRANLGFVRWTWLHNYGAAGGMLYGDRAFLIAIGLLVTAFFFTIPWFVTIRSYTFWLGWGLGTGGTMGNLWDRIVHGYVTDMFQFPHQHGVFNLSDLAINLGFILMIVVWIAGEVFKSRKSQATRDREVVELTEDSANE